MNRARDLLKKYFGYDDFRVGQASLIEHILNGEDVLGIMPTGAGKSICYQIPAIMFDGVTIVISPLISLMKDQVDSLNDVGISSTFINSTLTSNEYGQVVEGILNNVYKIIYIAPERLDSEYFTQLLDRIKISMIAIDEAHCVSQWGHDFRPSYTRISSVISSLKKRPIVSCFTATATQAVKTDIINLLDLHNPFTLTSGFDRKNLKFYVETPVNKFEYLKDFLEKKSDETGIIYCSTRKNVDSLYDKLQNMGYSVSKYHAGMSENQREISQNDFTYDRTRIMVATNAFGMGIDKSNIRYVVHYNMPKDLESYYQEAGRSGRDGDVAECVLLFSRADIVTNKFLLETVSAESKSFAYEKLNDMIDYCNTDKCLRKYILEYFGEHTGYDKCDNCGNCLSDIELTDITIDSQKILSCIKRMGEHFGSNVVTDVLKGANTQKIRDFGFDKLSTYGIMHDYSKDTIKDLIYFLITEGYVYSVGSQYPYLRLDNSSKEVLFGGKQVFIKRKIEKIQPPAVSRDMSFEYDNILFGRLRELRRMFAEENNVPPFVIFSDYSLKLMACSFPISKEQMMAISGVGENKFAKYGEEFINIISDYVKENDVDVNKYTAPPPSKTSASSKPKIKGDTKTITYNLYKEGKSIDEICSIRELSRQTIEEHLIKCVEAGMDLDLTEYVNTEYKKEILDVIQKVGIERLKPIKEILPDEVSYFDIKYYVALEKLK